MRKLKKWIIVLILALTGTVSAIFMNLNDNFRADVNHFQKEFIRKEQQLKVFLEREGKSDLNLQKKSEYFYLHVFRNDSLVFWNSNELPVNRFADLHFPGNGLLHLQNGWYYTITHVKKNKTFCASFLIKKDFPYENGDLTNDFQHDFSLEKNTTISLDQNEGIQVKDASGNFILSLVKTKNHHESPGFSQFMLFFYLIIILLWVYLAALLFKQFDKPLKWLIPFFLLFTKWLLLNYNLVSFRVGAGALDPTLYGTSKWFPNYFEYLTNITVIISTLVMFKSELKKRVVSKVVACLLFPSALFSWILVRDLTEGLVENSSIPLSIDRLFSLNGYTILAITSVGIMVYVLFEMIRFAKEYWLKSGLRTFVVLGITLVVMGGFMCWIYFMEHETIIPEISFTILLLTVLFYDRQHAKGTSLLGSVHIYSMGILCVTLIIMVFNGERAKTIQELYAQKLASEQSVVTELEYPKVEAKVAHDPVLTRIKREDSPTLSASEFEDGLERRIFNGFWERYELDYFLFDSTGTAIITEGEDLGDDQFEKLHEIIRKHGALSAIDSHLYFINDHTDQYSYIIRQKINENSGDSRIFIATLRSKKIPEEIGFPRLLISGNSDALQNLEDYSIAKYHKNKLVVNYGKFHFPYTLKQVYQWPEDRNNYKLHEHYMHHVHASSNGDVIILSSPEIGFLSYVTSFSYLFLFFGFFFTPRLLLFSKKSGFLSAFPLSLKIQVILIGIVFLSLIGFGWGSGSFIRDQYTSFSTDMITDKLRSIMIELNGKLKYKDQLSLEKNGNSIESMLDRIAHVYRADVNMYDTQGFMIASSRPKIYTLGLVGEQMNPNAFNALTFHDKSLLVEEERIGNLAYASVYMPSFNKQGNLLGFVNLQYFGQQRELEDQIEHFITAIINIFMLLLAISLISALFISTWLTAPLRLLKESVSKLRLGKINEPINYRKNDEIGALVTAYNMKLEELEKTAAQLARSEREMAWREMAKQVAHEIKNPLTPMKLSVQQLERTFDPNDPSSVEKIKKVASSLIEQIDALTRIANEFSQFAQMPQPTVGDIDLMDLIENVVHVFQETTSSGIQISSTSELFVSGDKDQLIRVFNNLIKNAIQSVTDDEQPKIQIDLSSDEKNVFIAITDNGCGIKESEKSFIFTPHFTTKSGGSGLGLAMVKQIIENHKGKIEFTSQSGIGTTFSIQLPKI